MTPIDIQVKGQCRRSSHSLYVGEGGISVLQTAIFFNFYLVTVNVVIFAGGKFRENVGKTFHVGVIFTILLVVPSFRHMGFIFAWG